MIWIDEKSMARPVNGACVFSFQRLDYPVSIKRRGRGAITPGGLAPDAGLLERTGTSEPANVGGNAHHLLVSVLVEVGCCKCSVIFQQRNIRNPEAWT